MKSFRSLFLLMLLFAVGSTVLPTAASAQYRHHRRYHRHHYHPHHR